MQALETLLKFAHDNHLHVVIGRGQQGCKLYSVSFRDIVGNGSMDIVRDSFLRSSCYAGTSIEDAARKLIQEVSGERIVFNACDDERRREIIGNFRNKKSMTVIDNYYVDENGNKWNTDMFAKHIAEKHSESMKNCVNCINCADCVNCINCTNCKDCVDCAYCKDCSNCDDCTDCLRCKNCVNCKDCKDSISCTCRNKLYMPHNGMK